MIHVYFVVIHAILVAILLPLSIIAEDEKLDILALLNIGLGVNQYSYIS